MMNASTSLRQSASALLLSLALSPVAFSQDAKVDFESQVLPIFKDRCFECHQKEFTDDTGRLKKPKGKFRMDNPALMLKGGSEGGDLTPGDPDKSTVYTYTLLPEDDDLAMPPKGDRLTDEQKELIKKWIAEGASFGTWKGAEE
jgi:mono/diheme cytochrome c family protein